jgi:hypothetical protein
MFLDAETKISEGAAPRGRRLSEKSRRFRAFPRAALALRVLVATIQRVSYHIL